MRALHDGSGPYLSKTMGYPVAVEAAQTGRCNGAPRTCLPDLHPGAGGFTAPMAAMATREVPRVTYVDWRGAVTQGVFLHGAPVRAVELLPLVRSSASVAPDPSTRS